MTETTEQLVTPMEPGRYPSDKGFAFDVQWWDSGVILGPVAGNPGGEISLWAKGSDFADAAANAWRYVESMGHIVSSVSICP